MELHTCTYRLQWVVIVTTTSVVHIPQAQLLLFLLKLSGMSFKKRLKGNNLKPEACLMLFNSNLYILKGLKNAGRTSDDYCQINISVTDISLICMKR